ncbi:MAG: fibronectin type III domain-containing protein, partial [Alistipes sp.]|nr:fibronectin type III domain-containing protein [Alistipes sp.]
MKKFLLIAALFCGIYSAQAIKIIRGPYLQSVTDTEATVVWVTDKEAISWVECAPVDGSNFYNVERPKFYQTYLGKRVFGTVHQITIKGLEPGHKYCYSVSSKEVLHTKRNRVHYGDVVTARIYGRKFPGFYTLDPKKESTQFIVLNDIHAKQEKMDALLNTFEKG